MCVHDVAVYNRLPVRVGGLTTIDYVLARRQNGGNDVVDILNEKRPTLREDIINEQSHFHNIKWHVGYRIIISRNGSGQ